MTCIVSYVVRKLHIVARGPPRARPTEAALNRALTAQATALLTECVNREGGGRQRQRERERGAAAAVRWRRRRREEFGLSNSIAGGLDAVGCSEVVRVPP